MRVVSPDIPERLRALAAALTAIRGRLEELSAELPEEEPQGEGEESSPGLRSILSCIRTDALDIAIRDLGRAAEQEGAAAEHAAGHVTAGGRVYAAVIARIDRALPHLVAEHERQQREAEELFVDLAWARADMCASFRAVLRLLALRHGLVYSPTRREARASR